MSATPRPAARSPWSQAGRVQRPERTPALDAAGDEEPPPRTAGSRRRRTPGWPRSGWGSSAWSFHLMRVLGLAWEMGHPGGDEQEHRRARSGNRWPRAFDPARSPVHVVNRLDVPAPPEAVWSTLVAATRWPLWYANAADVRIEGGGTDLRAGSRFRWRTFGFALDTVVEEFEPPERLAWLATAPGIRAYHAWLITPREGGCRVVTEETQRGAVARLGRLLFRGRMGMWHQRWLEGLARQSRAA